MNIILSPIRSHPFLKSCYSHIRELRCIRPYLDSYTTSTIAALPLLFTLNLTTVTLSSLLQFPKSEINRFQQVRLARTVVRAPKSSDITHILRSLHWIKINVEYKLLSLTYKVLTTYLTTYTILSLFSLHIELAAHLLSP